MGLVFSVSCSGFEKKFKSRTRVFETRTRVSASLRCYHILILKKRVQLLLAKGLQKIQSCSSNGTDENTSKNSIHADVARIILSPRGEIIDKLLPESLE